MAEPADRGIVSTRHRSAYRDGVVERWIESLTRPLEGASVCEGSGGWIILVGIGFFIGAFVLALVAMPNVLEMCGEWT